MVKASTFECKRLRSGQQGGIALHLRFQFNQEPHPLPGLSRPFQQTPFLPSTVEVVIRQWKHQQHRHQTGIHLYDPGGQQPGNQAEFEQTVEGLITQCERRYGGPLRLLLRQQQSIQSQCRRRIA